MTVVRTLFDEAEIARRVEQLGGEVAAMLPKDAAVVGLLKGSFVFVADLARALARSGLTPSIEFLKLSSYGAARTSSGEVRLVSDLTADMAGRQVLLADDIVDTGRTLAFARSLLLGRGAERVVTCALIDKPSRREVDINADVVGFTVPDVFVVGYGIDHAERYRYLPYIATIDPDP